MSPTCLPAGRFQQKNGTTIEKDEAQRLGMFAKIPVRMLSPVLAGIRAGKHDRLAFPCGMHSGLRDDLSMKTLDHRCGGSTRGPCGLVFPV